MGRLIQQNKTQFYNTKLSLRDFYANRNKVLIVRDTGGLGDILMCRMMFEDFKRLMPEAYIVFAIPIRYHDAVRGHPFIDEVADSQDIDVNDFGISYDITTACGRHENSVAPLSDKNRSDIWANHCGVELQKHNMHFHVSPDLVKECRVKMEQYRTTENGPLVLLCPISAMLSKNLDEKQMNGVLRGLKEMDCLVLGFHKMPIYELQAPAIQAPNLTEFFAFIAAADYIVTVDTGAFHAAGGLDKPVTAVFSWVDGLVYGKWYSKVTLVQRHRNWTPGWTCGPCYKWGDCPKTKENRKPCITEITADEVLVKVKEMMEKFPLER